MTAVLCLDFFSMSGFRYLTKQNHVRTRAAAPPGGALRLCVCSFNKHCVVSDQVSQVRLRQISVYGSLRGQTAEHHVFLSQNQADRRRTVEFLHFDVGVGEPVDIHRCQVRTALHTNVETFTATSLVCFTSCCSTLQTEWWNKLQREKKTTSLLQTVQLFVLPLQTK